MKFILLLLVCFLTFQSYSQKGTVIFRVAPVDALIKVNGKTYQALEPYLFETGVYTVEAWLEKHEYVKLEFAVEPHQTNYVTFGLDYTKEYKKYKSRLSQIRTLKATAIFFVPALTVSMGARNLIILNRIKSETNTQYDRLVRYKSDYDNAVFKEDINDAEVRFNSAADIYNEKLAGYDIQRKRFIRQTTGLVLVNIGIQVLAMKLKKPEYSESVKLVYQQNPFNQSNQIGLAFNINLK